MTSRTLMVMGTRSNVGKSFLCTGLCRYFSRIGLRVAPFKAMNLSLNAAVTCDGGEIARSTFTQAKAAGVEATTAMNPVLIKPEANQRSQIVLDGVALDPATYASWEEVFPRLWEQTQTSLAELRQQYDLVIIEGSGSPAEPNLQQNDLSNMRLAHHAQSPVVLVGDIELGGVFASLLGTLSLLEEPDRARVRAMIVNRYRGDPSLFADYLTRFQSTAFDKPILGVVPLLDDVQLPTEDGLPSFPAAVDYQVDVAIVAYPQISNTDEFQPLAQEPGLRVRFVNDPLQLGRPDAVILPGSKSTVEDLQWLKATGLAAAIVKLHHERDVAILGLCGGYQMLGERLSDHNDTWEGLGLLPTTTGFEPSKQTRQVQAKIPSLNTIVGGYEIHTGSTVLNVDESSQEWSCQPFCEIVGDEKRPEGVVASRADGRAACGTYLHGLFENDGFRQAWLGTLGWKGVAVPFDPWAGYDRLADGLADCLDLQQLQRIIEKTND